MIIRRLLLDGVKIIEPYRRELQRSHRVGLVIPAEETAIFNEVALMALWVKMARLTALKLKRAAKKLPPGEGMRGEGKSENIGDNA